MMCVFLRCTTLFFFLVSFGVLKPVMSIPNLAPRESEQPSLPGTFVKFQDLSQCPSLPARTYPTKAKDVRPDDFRVVMALGDSIIAGFLARPSPDSANEEQQAYHLSDIREYRGVAYPMGGDEGAVTIPNIIEHYRGHAPTGVSTGDHIVYWCPFGIGLGLCSELLRPKTDGLNAALSGSYSVGLKRQVSDFLLTRIEELDVKDEDWKLLTLQIGTNDVCAFCLEANSTMLLPGSPKHFAGNIKRAIDHLRKSVPNLIVNIVGVFKVSAWYEISLNNDYCKVLSSSSTHDAFECQCGLLPGAIGDYSRRQMDELAENYDAAVLEVIKEWEAEEDDSFGVMWQPGSAIDILSYPVVSLSPIDCFHPSEKMHQRIAAGLWNRLTLSPKQKYTTIDWEDDVYVRCLEEDDRVQVGKIADS